MSVIEQYISEARNILETTTPLYPYDIIKLINGYPELIKYIPKECMNESLAVSIVDINGNYIKYLPNNLASIERVMKVAINNDTNAFRYIKKENLTYEVCKYVVNLDYRIIHDIPKEYKTKAMRELAAKKNEPIKEHSLLIWY